MSRNVLDFDQCGFVYLIRKLTRLNQEDFGVLIGVSKNCVSLYETMQIFPSVYVLQKFQSLGIEPFDILTFITCVFKKDNDLNRVCSCTYEWCAADKFFYSRWKS